MERKSLSSEKGQAMVEFVIVFPIQLFFTLAIMQLCLMYVGKQLTEYAAFRAARSYLVLEDKAEAKSAAAVVLKPAAFSEEPEKRVTIIKAQAQDKNDMKLVKAQIAYDYELIIPVIGDIFANPRLGFLWFGESPNASPMGRYINGIPHLRLYGYSALVGPK